MKKEILLTLLLLSSCYWTFGQVLYDNGPIILNDPSARFSTQGNKWSTNDLTYFFQNGTNDIVGTNERQAITDAFELWACVTPLTFTEVSSASNADIVILWGTGSHGDDFPFDGSGSVLAHAFFPPPNGGAIAGDIHFDEAENWTLNTRSTGGQPIDLVTVAAHEIGHSLGLNHSSDPDALMFAFYSGSHRFLDSDDIEGIQSIYGSSLNNGLTNLDHVCNSQTKIITYSDPCGTGTSVLSWSASNNVQITSSNSTSITVSGGQTSGSGFVRATLNNGITITERFWVGKPTLYDASISGSNNVGCNSIYIYDYLGSVGGASSTRWVVSLQFDNISSVNGYELFVDPTNGGDGFVTFVASNDCGEDLICKPVSVTGWSCGPGYINFPTQYSCGGVGGGFPSFGLNTQSSDFTVFPNPTPSGETTVLSTNQETLSVETSGGSASRKSSDKVRVDIYRASDHVIVFSDSFENEQFQIKTSHLKQGTYYYVITRGETREVKRIIVE